MKKGYQIIFGGQDSVIYNKNQGNKMIEKVKMTRNRLFLLIITYRNHVRSFKVTSVDDYWLWNFWFGHFHFSHFRLLHQKQIVRGLPPIKEPSSNCDCCILGKKHCESFIKGITYREKKPLELGHTCLCGPM